MKSVMLAAALAASLVVPAIGQDAFPVTIEHAFGETVIENKPVRIVTLSWMSQETIIALGEMPVAMQFQGWGGNEEGYLPWIVEAAEERGVEPPPTIDTTDGIPFEQILGYEPDLIFAPYSGFDQAEYDRLTQIAPTVPYQTAAYTGTWQHVVETAGLVLGKTDEAAALIEATEDRLASYKDDYPVIAGKSFVFAGGGTDGANVSLYIPTDPRIGLMRDIGLVPAEGLSDLPTDNFTQPVSLERIADYDADVFVGWFPDEENVELLLANPLFARWAPITEGHFVPVVDRASVMALSAPSPLSIPWMMDRFVPELAEALE